MSKKEQARIDKEMGLTKRGRIKIVSKRIFVKGEPHYEILHVEAAKENDLPPSYTQGFPCCYYVETYDYKNRCYMKLLHIRWIEDGKLKTHNIKVGDNYKIQEFNTLMSYVEAAGERLTSLINGWKKICFKDGVNVWKGNRIDTI